MNSGGLTKPKRQARHIAVLTHGLKGGGVQRMMRHVADELASRGFKVDVLVPSPSGKGDELPNMRLLRLRRWPRSVAHFLALKADPDGFRSLLRPVLLSPFVAAPLGLIPALSRYLRSEQPDGLMTGTTYMNLAAIWSRELSGASTKLLVS